MSPVRGSVCFFVLTHPSGHIGFSNHRSVEAVSQMTQSHDTLCIAGAIFTLYRARIFDLLLSFQGQIVSRMERDQVRAAVLFNVR